MKHQALLQLGTELMHLFRHGNSPADRELSDYVRNRRFLGATDKKYLGDNFFHTLRHMRRIDEAILSAFSGQPIAETFSTVGFPITSEYGARTWMRQEGKRVPERQTRMDRVIDTLRLGLAAIERGADQPVDVAQELTRCFPTPEGKLPLSVESLERMTARAAEVMELYRTPKRAVDSDRAYSFPSWLWSQLSVGRYEEEMRELGAAINEQAPTTLRINSLKTKPEEAKASLAKWKHAYTDASLAPLALHLPGRASRGSIPHLEDGWFEMQDEGSQLISIYASPEPGMIVVDPCAGSGGKSLHLADLMGNRGRILAADAEASRLKTLPRRAGRAGASIVELVEGDDFPAADLVLIDAPCSGTGAMRRNPETRWRLNQAILMEVREAQLDLLDKWAARVKPGGHLVYATCSLLGEENEAQVDRFLAVHKEYRLDPPTGMAPELLSERGELKLLPHRHGTDGFYAARLQRVS